MLVFCVHTWIIITVLINASVSLCLCTECLNVVTDNDVVAVYVATAARPIKHQQCYNVVEKLEAATLFHACDVTRTRAPPAG